MKMIGIPHAGYHLKQFEETLNYYNFIQRGSKMEDLQLDLLFPIKEKSFNKIKGVI